MERTLVMSNFWLDLIPTEFVIVDSSDTRFFQAIQCRRATAKLACICRRSGSRVVDDVISLRQAKRPSGKLTCQKLHAHYQGHLGDTGKDKGSDATALNMSRDMTQCA